MSFRSTSPGIARRAVLAVLTAAATVAVIAGCAGAPQQEGSATSGTVNWWGFTPQPIAAEQYIAAFNEEYPDIEVVFRQLPIDGYDAALRPALASSNGPDVFAVAPGGGIASVALYGNSAIDLTPAIEDALGDDWQDLVSATGIEPLTVDGELRALSIGSTFAGNLWINQDLFDEYGLEHPTTLDEWKSVCEAFREGGQGCFVQGAGQVAFNQDTLQSIADSVEPGVWTAASKGEADWNDPAIVEALTIWKDLFDSGIMPDGALGLQQYPDASNAFLGGQYAMVQMGTWYMQYATAAGAAEAVGASGVAGAEPFTMLAIPFPDVAGAGNPSQMYGDSDWGLAVNAKSKNQAAATTFATWLTTSQAGQQEVANILNDIPALNGIQPQWDAIELVNPDAQAPNLQELIETTTTVSEPRLSLVSSELQQAIGVASTTVAAGEATPQEAADTLQATVGSQ